MSDVVSLPAGIGYGTVRWTAVQMVIDSIADVNDVPDVIPMTGSVTFAPSISRLETTSGATPVTLFLRPIVGTLYSDGTLRDPQGTLGVRLLATDSTQLDAPAGSWTWTARFALNGGAMDSVEFTLAAGSVVDLTSVVPSAPAPEPTDGLTYTYNSDGTVESVTDGDVTQTYVYAGGELLDVSWLPSGDGPWIMPGIGQSLIGLDDDGTPYFNPDGPAPSNAPALALDDDGALYFIPES